MIAVQAVFGLKEGLGFSARGGGSFNFLGVLFATFLLARPRGVEPHCRGSPLYLPAPCASGLCLRLCCQQL
jgi:hypothetical protein